MRIYVISLAAGLLVGIFYSLLGVRSPAPPVVALLGLLGMLIGEQIVPVTKAVWSGHGIVAAWQHAKSGAHMFGMLPGRHAHGATAPDRKETQS
jgi:XapX domain-containing protein